MRTAAMACCAAMGLVIGPAVQAGGQPDQTPAAGLTLPDGEGRVLVERVCAGCHDPALVMFRREDEEEWAVIVNDMAARGAKGTPGELEAITRYLAANFNRAAGYAILLPQAAAAAAAAKDDGQREAVGGDIYGALCAGCHQPDGRGKENVAPTLVASELTLAPAGVPTRIMLHGKRGPTNVMPALGRFLTDEQIAATLTYIRRAWGNAAPAVDPAAVRDVRTATSGRARPWTVEELREAVTGWGNAQAR